VAAKVKHRDVNGKRNDENIAVPVNRDLLQNRSVSQSMEAGLM